MYMFKNYKFSKKITIKNIETIEIIQCLIYKYIKDIKKYIYVN